jgi:hypothetical protein
MAELPCNIKICFGNGSLFKSAGFETALEEGICKEMRLQPQLGDDVTTKVVIAVAKGVKVILEVMTGFGPVLNYLFGFGLGHLASLLEGIQLLVYYPMLEVNASSNLSLF